MAEIYDIRIESNRKRLIYCINACLFFVFVLLALIMPADTLNIKKGAFVVLFCFNIFTIGSEACKSKYYAVSFHIAIFPIVLFVSSMIAGGSLYATVSNIYVCFYAGLILVAVNRKNSFENLLLFVLRIMAIIIVLSVILDFTGLLDIYNNKLLMNLYFSQDALVGKSTTYWSYYTIFLKASPLILILLAYSLKNNKHVFTVISFIALYLSGTRANFFAAVILVIAYVLIMNNNIYMKLLSIVIGLFILTLFSNKFIEYFENMFFLKQVSDSNKIQDYIAIFSLFKNHPLTFFIGTGFGDAAAIANYGFTTGTSELSYLDLLRKMGVIGFIPFMYFVLKPFKALIQNNETKFIMIAYVSYLLVAATNPLLFSSTAYIMFIYIYIKYYQLKASDLDISERF